MVDDPDAVRRFIVRRLDATGASEREERVAHEEPLEIQVNGHSVAVVMRTPGHDLELALGFLLSERIVATRADVESLRHCTVVPDPEAEDNVVQVRLRPGVPFDLERLRRHTFASSSCGICGKATIENACALAPPLPAGGADDGVTIDAAVLLALPGALLAAQPTFASTGGLHGIGLFATDGALRVAREDVGRHNAVDKVIGWAAEHGVDAARHVLLVSGRVSFEMVQKAAAARIPVVAGISAPTSLAVRMADALGITVIGFLRGASMNVYTHAARVRA